jgi:hypothetical protein
MRSLFKWVFRIALALVLLAIVLVVALLLLKDTLAKSAAEKNLRDSTGMDAKIAKFDVGVLTHTVDIEGLKIYNKPEFGGGTFLELPELRVEVVPESMRSGKLRFKTMRVNLAEVTVVRNADGKLNTEDLAKETKRKTSGEKSKTDVPGVDFGGIDTVIVSIGTIKVRDLRDPRNNADYVVGMKEATGHNLKTEDELRMWLMLQVTFAMAQQASATGKGLDVNTLMRLFGGKPPKTR